MSRRFHRKNHNGKWTANRVDGGLRFRERSTPVRNGILASAAEISKDNTSEREVPKPKEWNQPETIRDVKDADEVIKRIDVSGFVSPILLSVHEYYPAYMFGSNTQYIRIQAMMTVNDRDSGFPIPLFNSHIVQLPISTNALLHHIRNALHAFVAHEIDEQFKFNGKRIFEPHPYGL